MAPGLSQRLSQAAAADHGLFRVPSESAVQHEPASTPAPAPPAPPLPAANTGGLAEALKSATLRKTPKVYFFHVRWLFHAWAFAGFVISYSNAAAILRYLNTPCKFYPK